MYMSLHTNRVGVYHCGLCDIFPTMYNIEQAAALYNTSAENARRWAIEFREYLSENANPPDHRKRLLNEDDLAVFSLIAEMRQQGHVFKTIHEALAEGRRGIMPASPDAVVPADKTRLAKLQADVNRLNEVVQQLVKDVERKDGRIEELTAQVEARQRELREAYEEIGRLKGVIKSSG